MSSVLLIPMIAPMQSWGTRSRFQERDTEREPSKSGVIGLLCAAIGRDREESIDDLIALKIGVRIDREGSLKKDFQTAQHVAVASGGKPQDQISNRHYLADAAFLVGLEGDEALLNKLHVALANPVWPLFLGRKSYVPSIPLYLHDALRNETDIRNALLEYPFFVRDKKKEKVRIVLESSRVTHESRMDTPVSFAIGRREFREHFVSTEFVPIETFSLKEENDVYFSTHS